MDAEDVWMRAAALSMLLTVSVFCIIWMVLRDEGDNND